ncbi:MAG: sacsin N-terminal ATP-binding-like domain-containing protein, partial [Sciscionella sp.]
EIDDNEWSREQDGPVVVLRGPECTTRWLPYRTRRVLAGDELAGLGVEARQRPEFAVCWALPVDKDGVPVAAVDEVLHAPTPTDEKLSLPARLLATVPLEPGRRRVLPGAATAAMLSAAAETYPGLVRELPAEHRVSLIPTPGFPMSEVDSMLRDGILDALRRDEWLPSVAGGDVTPSSACVLEVVSPRLVELLAGVVPGLLGASFSASRHASGMASLGVRRMGLADVVDALAGVRRPPGWWAELYGALSALESLAISELAGLPVPLVDGRTVLGPRQVLLAAPELSDLLPGLDTAGPVGLRIAHPDAAHPLLQRLGARRAGPPDLLESPELVAAVESSVDDALAGVNTAGLADTVLRLLRETSTGVAEHPWLAALALPDSAGGWRGAGELLLPDAALLAVLDHDAVGEHAPLGVLATSVEQPREVLTATGVLDSFAVLARDAPIAADHDLADEVEWFSAIGGDLNPPDRLVAVRDLDLVADDRWPEALRMLAAEPRTRRALDDPAGYTAWWLRRYAVLAGRAPEQWRLPDASGLAGLYDPLPELGVDRAVLLAVGVRDALEVSTVDDVIALLDRLGDPERVVPQGVVLQVHGALATAVSGELIDTSTVDPPDRVRSLAGTAVDAGSALVADRPWLLALLPEDRTVGVPEGADAAALADLLDVGLASEEMAAAVGGGDPVAWSELGAVLLVCELLGVAVPDGQVVVHEELRVLGGTVRWWSDAGVLHAQDSSEGLARALAWALGRWRQRHLIAAMLDDPDPATLLS